MLGGQVGLADHVDIGDAATVGGRPAVVQDVPAGQNLAGSFARPADPPATGSGWPRPVFPTCCEA